MKSGQVPLKRMLSTIATATIISEPNKTSILKGTRFVFSHLYVRIKKRRGPFISSGWYLEKANQNRDGHVFLRQSVISQCMYPGEHGPQFSALAAHRLPSADLAGPWRFNVEHGTHEVH